MRGRQQARPRHCAAVGAASVGLAVVTILGLTATPTLAETTPVTRAAAAASAPGPAGSSDLIYDALVAGHIQVYERVAVRPAHTVPASNQVVMRKVDDPTRLGPAAVTTAYVGLPLPGAFAVAETAPGSGLGWGVVLPVDPQTFAPVPFDGTTGDVRYVQNVTGPVGPLATFAVSIPYFG